MIYILGVVNIDIFNEINDARVTRMTLWLNCQRLKTAMHGDHLTPAENIDRVCVVLGEIDLDPASNPTANKIVRREHDD